MRYVRLPVLIACLFAAAGGLSAQDSAAKKYDGKETGKADSPRAKGYLPQNWSKLGLTDEQRQKVYQIQGKYNEEIDKLEVRIRELKDKMARERLEVLSPEQKKRLEDIIRGKAGTGEK